MQLTVHDLCRRMRVNERTVRRWVGEQQLPAYRIGGRYHFNRSELVSYASQAGGPPRNCSKVIG